MRLPAVNSSPGRTATCICTYHCHSIMNIEQFSIKCQKLSGNYIGFDFTMVRGFWFNNTQLKTALNDLNCFNVCLQRFESHGRFLHEIKKN